MSGPIKPKFFSPRPGSNGMDELQFAAYCGDLEAVKDLLGKGADPTAADDSGFTALHWNMRMACTPGERVAIIDALVAAGADLNHTDFDGRTVLATAIYATAPDEMIERLKACGAK